MPCVPGQGDGTIGYVDINGKGLPLQPCFQAFTVDIPITTFPIVEEEERQPLMITVRAPRRAQTASQTTTEVASGISKASRKIGPDPTTKKRAQNVGSTKDAEPEIEYPPIPKTSSPSKLFAPDERLTVAEMQEADRERERLVNPIDTLLGDQKVESTGTKSFKGVEGYHICLLSQYPKEAKQLNDYYNKYSGMFVMAERTFGVPTNLLACTCGRESRFDGKAKHGAGATGLCQATDVFLNEINAWLNPGPRKNEKLRKEWASYLSRIEDRLEDPSCKTFNVTKALIAKCPALGLGTASMYLRHISSRLMPPGHPVDKMSDKDWSQQSLETMVIASGAYNTGISFFDKILEGNTNRKAWPYHVLKKTCESWGVRKDANPAQRNAQLKTATAKFKELKGHMVALRNCLQKDSYLDHHGKPMGGQCKTNPADQQKQIAGLNRFKSSMPENCHMGRVESGSNSTTYEASTADDAVR